MTVATFTLILDLDDIPSAEDLEEVVERAREFSKVRQADLVITKEVRKSYA